MAGSDTPLGNWWGESRCCHPVPEIYDILRKSYDKLNDKQLPLLLDVACFLHGMLRSRLLNFTKTSCYDAYSDVKDLINKSLLVCVYGKDGKTIEVHALLKYMAWQIVNAERELRKRSRLENPKDITELMHTLKLVNLVELDLYGCYYLTALLDLSMSKHLEVLILHDFKSLVDLPSYVRYLDKLLRLDVEDCCNLERIPTKLKSKHLKYVLMSKCFKVTHCADINSKELEILDLDRMPISVAPPASIYNKMQQRGILSLDCPETISFPQVPARLEKFSLSNTSITKIELQVDMEGFTWLAITSSKLLKHVPSTINNMKFLQVLNFSGTTIETLSSCIQELNELLMLELSNCSRLESIPDIIHKLAKLSLLIVMGSKRLTLLPRLPPRLKLLSARFCKSLRALPSDIGRMSCPVMWFDCCSQLDRALLADMVSGFLQQVMPLYSQIW
ncbi:unnamed protein product [Linum tenue]|uniref:Uncharacterized protein n=1 Tax=Linum tenue TaxID=586396 RepID=A0AAV0PVL1_9ROSI|nr:unnamed protein product [Linum tenue]